MSKDLFILYQFAISNLSFPSLCLFVFPLSLPFCSFPPNLSSLPCRPLPRTTKVAKMADETAKGKIGRGAGTDWARERRRSVKK